MSDATVCEVRNKRNLGIDLLKAILALAIVCRHSAVISVVPSEGAGGGEHLYHLLSLGTYSCRICACQLL